MFFVLDNLGDGCVQISELVNQWEALAEHSVNGEELMDAFHKLDINNDGFIRITELKVITSTSELSPLSHLKSTPYI